MSNAEDNLERDLAMLEEAERHGAAHFRLWKTSLHVVVVGRAVDVFDEVEEGFCAREGIAIVRRPSGGRSVLIGPGTLQYSFTLPYSLADELASIPSAKRFCNRLLLAGLRSACGASAESLVEEASGDLVVDGRKVAGLALRRRRLAMLLHGTILVNADLALIARALKHPLREPAYRRGRSHEEFLTNLGVLDSRVLEATVRALLRELGAARRT